MLVLDNIKDGGIRLRSVLQLVLHKEDITSYKKEISCKIIEFSKATNTHSEYVKSIAITREQWLHEGSALLCYNYSLSSVY